MSEVAIIGAGSVARALGASLARAGVPVRFGVRDPDNAEGLPGPASPVADATASAEVVLLAVPASVAVSALRPCRNLHGKVLVDCTNPVRWNDGPVWSPPASGSVAVELARAYPDARVVKGFNHFGSEIQRDPEMPGGPADALFASDDPKAKRQVMDLARTMGFRPWDAGPLRNAALLENLAVTWIHMSSVGGMGRQLVVRLETRE
ncbi:MAG: NAD(P)-binding domain-containing protein [Gemmatimonadota bacterium]|jgi:predicted dinucleotide-binding enzyme